MPEYFECVRCKSREFKYKECGELVCAKCDCHYAVILAPAKPALMTEDEYKPESEPAQGDNQ